MRDPHVILSALFLPPSSPVSSPVFAWLCMLMRPEVEVVHGHGRLLRVVAPLPLTKAVRQQPSLRLCVACSRGCSRSPRPRAGHRCLSSSSTSRYSDVGSFGSLESVELDETCICGEYSQSWMKPTPALRTKHCQKWF